MTFPLANNCKTEGNTSVGVVSFFIPLGFHFTPPNYTLELRSKDVYHATRLRGGSCGENELGGEFTVSELYLERFS